MSEHRVKVAHVCGFAIRNRVDPDEPILRCKLAPHGDETVHEFEIPDLPGVSFYMAPRDSDWEAATVVLS